MPYKSEAQRRFFNSPAGKAKLGKEEVEQWNEESKGQKDLPEKVKDLLSKAIRSCDANMEFPTYSEALKYAKGNSDLVEHRNNKFFVNIQSKGPDPRIYKYTYKVRERLGNGTKPVQQFLKFESKSDDIKHVKWQINQILHKTKPNWEAYDIEKS